MYKLRLGVDLWEEYHLERNMEELRILLQRKNSAREEVRKYLHRNSNYVFLILLIWIYFDNNFQFESGGPEGRRGAARGSERR